MRLANSVLVVTLVGLVVLAAGACKSPTQITVEITTDVKCSDVRGTAITVGDLAGYENKPAVTVTPTCDASKGRIGSLVIVPSGGDDEQVALRLVMGLGRDPAECQPPGYGVGCIVARRALRFIPNETLYVPVFMAAVCEGVPCQATQTCRGGTCANAVIEDSSRCTEPNGCSESALASVAPPSTTDAGTADQSAPDAPVVQAVPLDAVAACGRPSTYVDDFTGGTVGPEWTQSPVGSATEQSGMLVIAATAGGQTRQVESRYTVDLTGDRLRVEIPRAPSAGTSAEIAVRAASGDELSFVVRDGTLTARAVAGATNDQSLPFDPVAHRWLQIRESGGQVQWETSPDAIAWTSRRSIATPSYAPRAKMVLTARSGTDAGQAYFSRLNAGRPRAPWCSASTLSDDFEDGSLGLPWMAVNSGACSYAEANGEVRFTMTGAGASYCAYESRAAYDLRGSAVYLEIPAITSFYAPVRFFLGVEDASGRLATLSFVGSNELEHAGTGIATTLTAYPVPSAEDWWRLREAGGTLFWETSGDGATWTIKRQAPAPFALDAVRIRIGVRTAQAMGGSISIGTPRFNLGGI